MPVLPRVGAVCAVAAAALLAAPSAHAANGDNGTVKIHDASTGEELMRNEPHVCSFYLDGFQFDGVQEVSWRIEAIAPSPNKGETVSSGTLTLDAEGHGRSQDMTLPDGHYKLYWNFDGENGSAKHKVFWTECEADEESGPSASPAPSESESVSASESPVGSEESSAGGSAGRGEGAPQASSVPSAQADTSGDLAETGNGAPVGLLSGVAAVFVAVGGALLFLRRRKAGQS
ncbi:LPXTG cell wall anchor domain-containing protein [Streptomyces sp. enrichment culture]|uniref:LPXTG cell wall anchor domain-containing protein n=1 Tax=Streptomyces sp. enrichment culture TaxID=1795815 RepID=UPI003F57DF09